MNTRTPLDPETVLTAIESLGNVSPNAMLVYSMGAQQFVYGNKPASAIFGLDDAKAFSASKILEFIPKEDFSYLTKQYHNLKSKKAITDVEFSLRIPRINHFSCDAYLLIDQKVIVIMLKEITQEKARENYMKEYGARKNALLEIIRHNLSGPLNGMQSVTQKFTDSGGEKQAEDLTRYLLLMEQSTSHCLSIISDLLKHEQIDSVEVNVAKERFNVIHKIEIILSQLRWTYPERQFPAAVGAEHAFILADEVKFLQVITILASNAIKFTSHRGIIALKIDEDEQNVEIKISDNGIGIPESMQPFLFDHKTVASRSGLDGQTSSGIGLSIAKKLINLMSGSIRFESKEGFGSSFYIRLPKV
jgi:two-component system, OmpR family, sensor histidine kinase VicK